MTSQVRHGLEGVLAGESAICEVDHASGHLSYRGYDIEDLAAHATYEEVVYLLLMGSLPDQEDFADFQAKLIAARAIPSHLFDILQGIPISVNRMDALRTAVSYLGMEDVDHALNTHEANLRKAIRLTAQMPALLAALHVYKKEDNNISPETAKSHAEHLLSILTDEKPDPFAVKALNAALILYAEHELNASTFAARVTASCLSDMHSAVVSGIGTLKGPLHGGANEAVMAMLLEVDQAGNARKYLSEKFSKKERVMGFGHRVLKKGDPRSLIIQQYAKALGERKKETRWYEISTEIERIMREEKGLHPNLDFYSASVFFLLGLPAPLYTPLFVCSRVAGWAAHVIEQHNQNRLIRPRCLYTGAKKQVFVPLRERGRG
ncbi:MAG: citrate/2-methylcitrate synthase [Nitrospiria bacterium]